MPLELQIIRASEFVRLGAHGQFDVASSKAALTELAAACHKRGIKQALMDLRALQPGPVPVFSPADLSTLVNTFHEIGFTKAHRLAVLYRSDPHRRARMFAFIGTIRGWNVRAFHDFEEALAWLAGGKSGELSELAAAKKRSKALPVRLAQQPTRPTDVRLRVR
jgi:hypothetical protein